MLLGKLGMYEAVLSNFGHPSDAEISKSPYSARLALRRCQALAWRGPSDWENANMETARILKLSMDPVVRVHAALSLVVHFSKREFDLARAADAGSVLVADLKKMDFERTPHLCLTGSKGYRALAFIPYHRGDRDEVRRLLQTAEALHNSIPASDNGALLKQENSHPLYETLGKEAQWRGDFDRAYEFAEYLAVIDGGDPKVYLQWGNVCANMGRLTEAVTRYRSAIALGPPTQALACLKLGAILEAAGDFIGAAQEYVASVKLEPRNRIGRKNLRRVGLLLENSDLIAQAGSIH
ncbi:hypothetical protein CK218_12840 [Mesorhizobium sp. WSM3879]|nr:hypothetical protein CK218_12840 [Mesorhizobium sp. WSM3879]